TVYKSTGSWYLVKTQENIFLECRIKGKLRLKDIKSTNPIAVGDIVEYELEQENEGIIKNVLPRNNYIVRKSVNLSKQTHIIASNIDLVFLLVTFNNPDTTTSFIDRFLVTAEAYHIETILIFNKIDTHDEQAKEQKLYYKYIYESIGYKTMEVSALHKVGIDGIMELMKGKSCMFSGHSGVGKSTLVNALDQNLNLKTASISHSHQQGQHTTTFAQMYDLEFGARIIDTPGIRGFGIVDIEPEELSSFFPEFFNLKNNCKFNNCLHKNEPHCAIKKALEQDELSWSRYNSYLQMLEGDQEQYRKDIYKEDDIY
ncbi:MAG: ribosome small subunit-dependent GTPase A, partial [Flavobacterium sp.]